jgi:hypothetical protein
MIERILPDLPGGLVWVAADEVYGRPRPAWRHWSGCQEHAGG